MRNSTGPKPKAEWFDREEFLEWRYIRWAQAVEAWGGILGASADLDADSGIIGEGGGTKVLRDVLLCDSCNEDITEAKFILLEEVKVYHASCASASGFPAFVWKKGHGPKANPAPEIAPAPAITPVVAPPLEEIAETEALVPEKPKPALRLIVTPQDP